MKSDFIIGLSWVVAATTANALSLPLNSTLTNISTFKEQNFTDKGYFDFIDDGLKDLVKVYPAANPVYITSVIVRLINQHGPELLPLSFHKMFMAVGYTTLDVEVPDDPDLGKTVYQMHGYWGNYENPPSQQHFSLEEPAPKLDWQAVKNSRFDAGAAWDKVLDDREAQRLIGIKSVMQTEVFLRTDRISGKPLYRFYGERNEVFWKVEVDLDENVKVVLPTTPLDSGIDVS